mmetsp:Transcript_40630/g.115035  ORF Transcript_40630/g.115035 Transcript_40630/m.115035 type:complete len:647 (-) Transcript_40630:219-2159(-)
MRRIPVTRGFAGALVWLACATASVHQAGGVARRLLLSSLDSPESGHSGAKNVPTARLLVKLSEQPENGLQQVEGIVVSVWAYDPWSHERPAKVASRVLLSTPELMAAGGMNVSLPLDELPPQFADAEKSGRVGFFVRLGEPHSCCRYTYSMDYVDIDPYSGQTVEIAPRLDTAVCNPAQLCLAPGAYQVQIQLMLDALPPGGLHGGEGVNVSLWAYNPKGWQPGQELEPVMVGETAFTATNGVSFGTEHSSVMRLVLPDALASLDPSSIAVYAAVRETNSTRYSYFGFQPLTDFGNEDTPTAAVNAVLSKFSNSSTGQLPIGSSIHAMAEAEEATPASFRPPDTIVAVRVFIDKAPAGGFQEGEGILVHVGAFRPADTSAEPFLVAEEVVQGTPMMLDRRGLLLKMKLDLHELQLTSSADLDAFRYYVALGALGGCCRFDYYLVGDNRVMPSTGKQRATKLVATLSDAVCALKTCSLQPQPSFLSADSQFLGSEPPRAAVANTPMPRMVRVGLGVNKLPNPSFADGEGILVSVWLQASKDNPLSHNFQKEHYKVAEVLVVPETSGEPVTVEVPIELDDLPPLLLRSVNKREVTMWATAGSPTCCRYDYFTMSGLALLDTGLEVPEGTIRARLLSEPCDTTKACTRL